MWPHLPAETLLLEGDDAAAFAHAQFSSKVDQLGIGQWQFSAWLDARGRVRTVFHLARLDAQRFLMLLRGGEAQAIGDALRRFIFRSRLEIHALPTRALTTGAASATHVVFCDGNMVSMGCGNHSLVIDATPASDDAWRRLQLHEGWPWLPTNTLDQLLPAAISLQRLDAVAVDKGCYPGQEIVARLHFRGGHKRHLHRGRLSQLVPAGDGLHMDGREVGRLLDVVACEAGVEALLTLSDDVAAAASAGMAVVCDNALSIMLEASWPA
ncbi:MAG: folate-binding protein [Rhodanobacter sp.]